MNTFAAVDAAQWRAWLADNHLSAKEIWLVIHHKGSGTPSIRYHEAVEQALCFGWIDGHHRKHDAGSSVLRFTPRRERSSWSSVNRERAARMTELGLMTEHGQAAIDHAKAVGLWATTPAGVPADLLAEFDRDPVAAGHFDEFPPSSKRLILEWIAAAKRPETRRRRITQTVELAARGIRANHPVSAHASGASRSPRSTGRR